jgi:hypothetical protein
MLLLRDSSHSIWPRDSATVHLAKSAKSGAPESFFATVWSDSFALNGQEKRAARDLFRRAGTVLQKGSFMRNLAQMVCLFLFPGPREALRSALGDFSPSNRLSQRAGRRQRGEKVDKDAVKKAACSFCG